MGLPTLVTSKATSVITQNLQTTLAIPSASITPSTLTAMAGLAQGGGLTNPLTSSLSSATSIIAAASSPTSPLYSLAGSSTLTNLSTSLTQFQNMFPSGNPAAFGQLLMSAQSHINDCQDLQKVQTFIAGTDFSDYGSGITNMSSLADHGLTNSLGNLPSAAAAFTAAGPCFDTNDMANFGTGTGLVNKLNSVKLGNSTGLNAALAANGVDLTRLNDPAYSETISKTLSNITDPTVIAQVKDQLGVTPYGDINNLNDLTDINKLANPSTVSGVTGGLSGIAGKFTDMGAKFASPSDAASMLNQLSVPSTPNLDAAVTSAGGFGSYINNQATSLKSLTGTGAAGGIPSMSDFTSMFTGGSFASALTSFASNPLSGVSNLQTMLTSNQALWAKAGVDLTTYTPPPVGLGSAMSFATGLHTLGADTGGSGVASIISSLASNDQYGDAIKASLIEGKNKALLAANGIAPLNFTG